MIQQVFANPQVLILTASILGILGLIPGMPNLVFLLLASLFAFGARRKIKSRVAAAGEPPARAAEMPAAASSEAQEASWSDVTPVDVLGLEVGYRLIPMVDKGQDGELLKRIRGLRKKFAQEVGFLTASVHIATISNSKPNAYRITLKGVEIGSGEAHPGQFMAINPGRVAGPLPGRETRDPAFGLQAFWIDAGQREQAHALGYTVVDSSTVVATHLNQLILDHAAELLGRQETQSLLDHIGRETPSWSKTWFPSCCRSPRCSECCRTCSKKGQYPRHAQHHRNPRGACAAGPGRGRAYLAGTHRAGPGDHAGALPRRCRTAGAHPRSRPRARAAAGGGQWRRRRRAIEPGLADTLLRQTSELAQRQESIGLPAVLLVPAPLRWLLSRFLRRSVPGLKVIANSEVPENRTIRVTGVVGTGG